MDMLKYKGYLKEFDYPNINGFSDEQILDLFTAKNRSFLLTWLVKNLNSKYIVPSDWSETTQGSLADIFHQSGFCRDSERLQFVKGALSISKQVLIFDRIFIHLQNSISDDEDDEDIDPNESTDFSDLLATLLNKDINLFPMYGPLQVCTLEERQRKMDYYKKRIEQLRQNIAIESHEEAIIENPRKYTEEEIETAIERFKEQASRLKEMASISQQEKKDDGLDKSIGFKPNFENLLNNCNSEIMAVSQCFDTINLSQLVNTKKLPDEKFAEQNEIYKIVKEHIQQCSEVVKLRKASAYE